MGIVNEAVVMLRTWVEGAEGLSDAEWRSFFTKIFRYAFDGDEPENLTAAERMAWPTVKKQIDSSNNRYMAAIENGKKGGRPKKADKQDSEQVKHTSDETEIIVENDETQPKPEPYQNQNQTGYQTGNQNQNQNENQNETLKEKDKEKQKEKDKQEQNRKENNFTPQSSLRSLYPPGGQTHAENPKSKNDAKTKKSKIPSLDEARAYAETIGLSASEAEKFFDHFSANGWKAGGKAPMADWQAALRNWQRNEPLFSQNGRAGPVDIGTFADRFELR
jgi:hypothetical protein